MKKITDLIKESVADAVQTLYGQAVSVEKVNLSPTRKGVEGDYTIIVFPYSRIARKKPVAIGEDIGQYLVENVPHIEAFNVIKGFLNLTISASFWTSFLTSILGQEDYGYHPKNGEKVMVEFSSPNTNKPLHLGHIRNNLLGWSVSKILAAAGHEVVKVQIINDRGVHICKSMVAWQKFGNGETPESSGMKGDFFVGKYYVLFDKILRAEYADWQKTEPAQAKYQDWLASVGGQKAQKEKKTADLAAYFFKSVYKNKYFNEHSLIGAEVKAMLVKWEANDPEIRRLWETMNGWVYSGFETTYKNLGVSFDKYYYESNTYLLGKDIIEKGLSKEVFYKEKDGSVWADLTDVKLDKKIVLRSDGTSVYMTQDLGTAQLRYSDFGTKKMVYVVGDEQEYHFQVLFEILKRVDEPYAGGLYHLSYGMVDLPTGKMKSREGKVVDADDLMKEVIEEAQKQSAERGTIADLSSAEQGGIIRKIGLGALKFFIIKVNPKKRMVFNPAESVDMQGQTGPYVQNAYVRTQSVMRKAGNYDTTLANNYTNVQPAEKELLLLLQQFPSTIKHAAATYNPADIANYAYELAKTYHKFWHDVPMLRSTVPPTAKAFRLNLSKMVGITLKNALDLLGIEVMDFM